LLVFDLTLLGMVRPALVLGILVVVLAPIVWLYFSDLKNPRTVWGIYPIGARDER
jgi:hypothetical protein